MIHKIYVNPRNCNLCGRYNKTTTRRILRQETDYLKSTLRYRGYLYLNQIYESLGIKWFNFNNNHWIAFDEEKINSVFTIVDDDDHDGFVIKVEYTFY